MLSKCSSVFKLLCIFLALSFIIFPVSTSSSILFDPEILETSSSAVFISMRNTTSHIVSQMNSLTFSSDAEKALAMVEALQAHALLSQLLLREFLTLAGVQFTPYWISNQIYIKDATPQLVLTIMNLFSNDVSQISKEIVIKMMPTFDEAEGVQPAAQTTEWGVSIMGAPEAWSQGCRGQGVRVAVLDTGCLGSHEQLDGKVMNWFDPMTGLAMHDVNGHGSHVCGTIAGNTVGMAPDASLLVCKCCDTAGCTESALKSCGQHICCPNADCSMKPHVVSCSWGGGGGQTFYMDIVNVWRSLGICPVFALGNSGPDCNTAGSPGDYPDVMGIAAMDSNKTIASFSSRGPAALSPGSNIKPQLTGPGVQINSCSHLSTTGYRVLSGTSMACPHISGMAALLQSNGNSLSYDQLLSIMKSSCSHNLRSAGTTCGGVSDNSFPNYVFGHGAPNCGKAVQILQQQLQQKQDQNNDSETNLEIEDDTEGEDIKIADSDAVNDNAKPALHHVEDDGSLEENDSSQEE